MRRHVVWVSTSRHTVGGIATVVNTLWETPLTKRWHLVHIASHVEGAAWRRAASFATAVGRLVVLLATGRVRLLHVHTASDGSFFRKALLTRVARPFGVPVVVHVHSGRFAEFHDSSPLVVRRLIRRVLEGADVVVVLSGRAAADLLRIAPASRVRRLPNVVPRPATTGRFQRADASASASPVTILFVGRLIPLKGLDTLLQAWAEVVPRSVPAELLVAGHGDVDGARRTVDELGIADTVRLLGGQSADQVAVLMDAADALVLPSLHEGQPMVVLEAMMHGLPVVASDVGGVPDLIEHGRSGLLVPPGDAGSLARALRRVIDEPELRRSLGRAAQEAAWSSHDAATGWKHCDELYRSILEGSPTPALSDAH